MISANLLPIERGPRKNRSGSVALMLVLVLALLVGAFASSVSSRVSHERRNELHRRQTKVLQSAISAVARSGASSDSEIRLPLDEAFQQIPVQDNAVKRWIIVKAISQPDEQIQYKATLYRNGQPGLSLFRKGDNEK